MKSGCECINVLPMYFYNPDTNQEEVDVLVCQDCLSEYPVSPMTSAQYGRNKVTLREAQ